MRRLALITGAAGGIGHATVEVFNAANWQVVAIDRHEAKFEPPVVFKRVDVADPEAISNLFRWLEAEWDQLDALVNNAAIQVNKPIDQTSVADWDRVLTSNLRSVFTTAREGLTLLKVARGAIVNVSSVHAIATSINVSAYAASKGGLLALTRELALELAPDGIRVNTVLPGAVDTQMLRDGLNRGHLEGESMEDKLDNLGGRTPLGRVGQPQEIARAIYFLADDEQSSFITGQSLVVDGGATARLSTE